MKLNGFAFTALSLLFSAIYAQGKNLNERLIALSNISVTPAGIEQRGSEIRHIADGKCHTDYEIFHTRWAGIPKQNITIEATLGGKGRRLDKVIISPRATGINGIIKTAELWIMTKGVYRKVANISAEPVNAPIQIEPDRPILNPEKIKLIIKESYNNISDKTYLVSLGELECVTMPEDAITQAQLIQLSNLLTGPTGIALKPEIRKKDIDKLKAPLLRDFATRLFENRYKPDSLIADYRPLLSPEVLGEKMRIGNGFSKLEGVTGIVLEKGDQIVFVGKTNGIKVKLLVPDWTRKAPANIRPDKDPAGWGLKKEVFILNEGANLVHLKKGGNVYIQYFTESNPDSYPPVTVHFPTGKYNGYFDITRGDNNALFDKLLSGAISPILDMKGKYIQAAFPVEALKKYAKGRGVELLNNYDTILGLQRQMLGWNKEEFRPDNHILARVNYHYYMFRDEDGVAFLNDAMSLVADPKTVISGDPCWGFSHEVGHVNQMRPQMTWGGMTEVSNNILTLFCTTTLGNKSRLSAENRYAAARKTILDKGISYMDFPGRAGNNTNQYGGDGNTDVFERLVPFWQLYLYFKREGYPDFYPDLMVAMRKQPLQILRDKNKEYLYMLEFCRLACEVSKTDLTEFFERWGFFYTGEADISDYSKYLYQITQSDVDAVKKAISDMKLPKPVADITQIED